MRPGWRVRRSSGPDTDTTATIVPEGERTGADIEAEWVGDPDQWLDLFWSSYQNIKHNPTADLDPSLIHALEVSGRWLLTSALLDECAGSKSPSRHLFGTSLWNVGHDVREHLERAS